MTPSDIHFNHTKFYQFILQKLGHGGIVEISKSTGISTQNISRWLNGRSKSGPSTSSWNKLKTFFAKRNIKLERELFYTIEETPFNRPELGEGSVIGYTENMSVEHINALITSLEHSVSNSHNLINQLKSEMKKLKK